MFDPNKIAAELQWLADNPHFDERPATVKEFLQEDYLNIERLVRPGVAEALADVFGHEVRGDRIAVAEEAMFTGAIGIGKTTFASIALPYMCHWVLCLKDPQNFYNLLPGSRIAFMQMSTSEKQALEVIFGDIKARIQHSRWFQKYPYDDKYTKQIRFPKDIWILPGDSSETTFEGYNILGGILDEMDSHKITQQRDYAEIGFDTIKGRIASRFVDNTDPEREGHKGLIIAIGQMKKAQGFAAEKYKEMLENPRAVVKRLAIWESFGWEKYTKEDGERNSFWYDAKRKQIVPSGVSTVLKSDNLIEIPSAFKGNFLNNPEKALRDLAGIPPSVSDPFISLTYRIDEAQDRWEAEHNAPSPVTDSPTRPLFEPWFRSNGSPLKRVAHLDLAVSGDGDALGFAMGHVSHLIDIDDEEKPFIVIDCAVRIKAMPGTEVMISDVRSLIYQLRDDRGFRLKQITLDGFESVDNTQQLRKRRFNVSQLSVDKSKGPYEDLRDALYDSRIAIPRYMTYLVPGGDKKVNIIYQELESLQDVGRKIDHPPKGSKDVADAIAGVVYTLMGDRTYRRGVSSPRRQKLLEQQAEPDPVGNTNTGMINPGNLQAPIPPSWGGLSVGIPKRLQPYSERGRP